MRRVNPVVYLDIIFTTICIRATKSAFDAVLVNFIVGLIITPCTVETEKQVNRLKIQRCQSRPKLNCLIKGYRSKTF